MFSYEKLITINTLEKQLSSSLLNSAKTGVKTVDILSIKTKIDQLNKRLNSK